MRDFLRKRRLWSNIKEVDLIRKRTVSMIVILALFMLAAVIPPQCTQAAYLGDRVLAYGSRGYDVQQLQKDLAYLGFNPGSIDGIFGPQTLAAVTRFQAHYGLNVGSVVGKPSRLCHHTRGQQAGKYLSCTATSRFIHYPLQVLINYQPGHRKPGPAYPRRGPG